MIGIYFKFRRFWSVRNLDLVGLICFSPGLLLVYHGLLMQHSADPIVAARGAELVQGGYVWLFAISGFFLVRLLLDPVMVRRPLLEPNLSASGLTFTGVALLVFLMANVITSPKERLEYELASSRRRSRRPVRATSGSTSLPALPTRRWYRPSLTLRSPKHVARR